MPSVLPHVLATMLGLSACATLADQPDPSTIWQLREIDGTPFTARATLSFPEDGRGR